MHLIKLESMWLHLFDRVTSLPLTPSFQPMSGMKPMTVTVMSMMLTVAMMPMMKLCVAIIRIGRQKLRPMMMPVTADDTSVWCGYNAGRNIHKCRIYIIIIMTS